MKARDLIHHPEWKRKVNVRTFMMNGVWAMGFRWLFHLYTRLW